MRFISYSDGGGRGLGIEIGQDLIGLAETAVPDLSGGLLELLRRGGGALAVAHDRIARQGAALDPTAITFLPPIARPSKVVCVGLNYVDHSVETGFVQPEYPTIFARFASSLTGAGAPLVRPAGCDQFDYEGELAAVIGRGGRHISRETALEHVAGYAPFNDASSRSYQFRTPQWTMGKNFDDTGAFGPAFVTADALPLGCRGLRLETRLNGEVVQSASTADMVFDVATLVALISETMTLEPGDVIVTGTPSGVGMARTPPLFMRDGDRVEVEIEGVGLLVNPVVDAANHPFAKGTAA